MNWKRSVRGNRNRTGMVMRLGKAMEMIARVVLGMVKGIATETKMRTKV